MPRLKDRNRQTPGGHKFYDPVLKYRARQWASVDEIAAGLVRARQGNPALTQQHGWSTEIGAVTNEVDETIAKHCKQMGWTDFYVEDQPSPPPNFQRPSLPPQRLRLGQKLRNVAAQGTPVLVDFIKSKEEAVPIKTAFRRAEICSSCPFNQKTKSLLDIFTVTASEAIRKSLEVARGWNLQLPNEYQLGVCERCSCPLPLKCWIPIERIREKISEEVRESLPDFCWIIKEGLTNSEPLS